MLRLPEPMPAKGGPLPRGRGWLYEPKLDGFLCLVCTYAGFRARSRRGWNMTAAAARARARAADESALDGELVALGGDGRPGS